MTTATRAELRTELGDAFTALDRAYASGELERYGPDLRDLVAAAFGTMTGLLVDDGLLDRADEEALVRHWAEEEVEIIRAHIIETLAVELGA